MTKFLNRTFSNFPIVHSSTRPEVVVQGGPAAEIPAEDRCSSGRHNLRLTSCWCQKFEVIDANSPTLAQDLEEVFKRNVAREIAKQKK